MKTGLTSFLESHISTVLLTTDSHCAPHNKAQRAFKNLPTASYKLKKIVFISQFQNMGLSGKSNNSKGPDHHCGCMYLEPYSQRWLSVLVPPTFSPCPSTLAVSKVSATPTFPDAHTTRWSSPKAAPCGLVITPALASLCLTPLSADICWSVHRQ